MSFISSPGRIAKIIGAGRGSLNPTSPLEPHLDPDDAVVPESA